MQHRATRVVITLAIVGALTSAFAFGTSASAARAAAPTTLKFVGQPLTTHLLNNYTQMPHGIALNKAFVACQGTTNVLPTGPCPLAPPADQNATLAGPAVAPHVSAQRAVTGGSGVASLTSSFDGISDVGQRVDTGYHFTPPDQGLCVGPAGPLENGGVNLGVPADQTVVVEMVNDGTAFYSTDGTQLLHESNANLFGDPYSTGDPECNYDKQAGTFFFTEIGALNGAYYDTNLVVMSPNGYRAYAVDTASGGYCFPDFPHQGFDANALYITVNQFCGQAQDYSGTDIVAISKAQLVSLADSPNGTSWTLGNSYYTFQPAVGNPTGTEYLLASEQNAATQNMLDVAKVKGDSRLDSGSGPIYLTVSSIRSQSYTEPVQAVSTGDGTTCQQQFYDNNNNPLFCSVAEAWIEPNDMRLSQVQYAKGQLYSSLPTALTIGADPTTYDGAAWFQVDVKKNKVVHQGYVAIPNAYVLMPSFARSKTGALLLGFSYTGPTFNPSTGYAFTTNGGKKWFGIGTAAGAGPHISFSGQEPDYLRQRWGDYSRIAMDPTDGSLWMSDEYVPSGPDGLDTVDNWGTRVWQVNP